MALTFTNITPDLNQPEGVGQMMARFADVAFDNNYLTGGTALTAAAVGFSKLLACEDLNTPITAGAAGKVVEFDITNAKLKLLTGALAEAGNASDQSGVKRRVRLWGLT